MLIKKRRRIVKSIMYAKSLLCVSAISNSRSILKAVSICISGMKAIYYLKIKMGILFFLILNLFLFWGNYFYNGKMLVVVVFFSTHRENVDSFLMKNKK